MNLPKDLVSFKNENRITEADWASANIEWDDLLSIGRDHLENSENLQETAQYLAKIIQKFKNVHSVRWRVKEVSHLMEKIVRKRAEKSEKYNNISVENYYLIITDLVGLRALHLFKDECFDIDKDIRKVWKPAETPIAYIRDGDANIDKFNAEFFKVEKHPIGYRSLHYICSTQPLQRQVLAEIQVRTIFEEGWSEIDHKIKYPNFSDDRMVEYFLNIFNRMAGSADEMGSFVIDLAKHLQEYKENIDNTKNEKDNAIEQMEKTLKELDEMKLGSENAKTTIVKLQMDLDKIKSLTVQDRFGLYADSQFANASLLNLSRRLGVSSDDYVRHEDMIMHLKNTKPALD